MLLRNDAVEVPAPAHVTYASLSDPDDLIFPACALSGGAQIIVSGDQHLISLDTWRSIRILTARDFLELLDHSEI